MPSKYSSGQACRSSDITVYEGPAAAEDVPLPGLEADGDAGRDVEGARHDRHRRREVHAVAALGVEELGDHFHTGSVVALVDGGIDRVLELVAREVVLQRQRLLVGRRRTGRDVRGGLRDDLGELRHLQVPIGRLRRERGREVGEVGLDIEERHLVLLPARVGGRAAHVESVGLVGPRSLEPLDRDRRVGNRQPVAADILHLHIDRVGRARHVRGEAGRCREATSPRCRRRSRCRPAAR